MNKSTSKPIQIVIVDDHEMVRFGLATYLNTEADMEVIAEATNGDDAFRLARELEPDIVLMDLVMDGTDGLEATKAITNMCHARQQATHVIVLTSFGEEDKALPAIEAGATSYLLKTARADEIASAIRKTAHGEAIIEGKVANILMNRYRRPPTTAHESLTTRERDVLRLLGSGKTNQQIADELAIGIKTVKTHVSNILSKLDVSDRTQAALYAQRHKLTDEPGK